jgi:hypothetical protein
MSRHSAFSRFVMADAEALRRVALALLDCTEPSVEDLAPLLRVLPNANERVPLQTRLDTANAEFVADMDAKTALVNRARANDMSVDDARALLDESRALSVRVHARCSRELTGLFDSLRSTQQQLIEEARNQAFVDPFAHLTANDRDAIVVALCNHYQLVHAGFREFMRRETLERKGEFIMMAMRWMWPSNEHELELFSLNDCAPIDEEACVCVSHRNDIPYIFVPPFVDSIKVRAAERLTIVSGMGCCVRRVDLDTLPHLTRLHVPHVADLRLARCPELSLTADTARHLFEHLGVLALVDMGVSDNILSKLLPLLQPQLRFLSLADNPLLTTLDGLAQRAPSLLRLTLRGCIGLARADFVGAFRDLHALDLSGTGITELPADMPPELAVLSVSNTRLASWPEGWKPRALKCLYVNNTRPHLLQQLPWPWMPQLQTLAMERVGLTNELLAAVPFDLLQSLRQLSIGRNPLVSALPPALSVLPLLSTLGVARLTELRAMDAPPALRCLCVGRDCGLPPAFRDRFSVCDDDNHALEMHQSL